MERAEIHEAACPSRAQGLMCSTCSDLQERAERAIRAGARVGEAAQPAPAPLTIGAVTNMVEIEAEIERQIETVHTHDRAVEVAQDAIYSTLTDEQQALFRAYEEADNIRDFEQMDLYVLDFGRHLPGLHPAIWALWRHMFESKQGECCRPVVDGIES